jgi:class 3 adenylate cyclase
LVSAGSLSLRARSQDRHPTRSYTPKHLAERILAEQAAMESRGAQDGERKTITAHFVDIKGSVEMMEKARPGGGTHHR